jgi:regulation of enolase protein 1 (concanavalin A-like superfamily)
MLIFFSNLFQLLFVYFYHVFFLAGFLVSYADGKNWAKLAFERSPQNEHQIVSVVTQNGVSDDCVHLSLKNKSVHLRVAVEKKQTAFHYSTDGKVWNLVN